MIKLLACDASHTIFDSDRVIPENLKEKLELLTDRGVKIGIVSGMSKDDLVGIFAKNGMGPTYSYPHLLVCMERNIYFLSGKEFIPWQEHNSRIAETFERCFGQGLHIYNEAGGAFSAEGWEFKKYPPHGHDMDFDIFKFNSLRVAKEARRYLIGVTKGSPFKVIRNGLYLYIIPEGMGKAPTLRLAIEKMGVLPEEVLAIGDSANDIEMLNGRFGFRSATVGNGEKTVKQAVLANYGYVAKAALGDGVCEIIEHFSRVSQL